MDADTRRAVLVFVALVALLAVPVGVLEVRDWLRPRLVDVRIVTASDSDPVFREGGRHVAADEQVHLAVALQVRRPLRGTTWLAPVERLVLDGAEVDHERITRWPESDRQLRLFWFTVECKRIGGDLDGAGAADSLAYQTFLAPELGRGLRATGEPEVHNDDYLGEDTGALPSSGGTIRLYARVEVVAEEDDVQALQVATTPGPGHVAESGFPAIHRAADLPAPIRPEVGELFSLPGFEPEDEIAEAADAATEAAWGLSFDDAVRRRLLVSAATFAATAAFGTPAAPADGWRQHGVVTVGPGGLVLDGRAPRWQSDVRAGDVLRSGEQWVLLVADDGDGVLGSGDRAARCWRRPPVVLPLELALDPDASTASLLRPER